MMFLFIEQIKWSRFKVMTICSSKEKCYTNMCKHESFKVV